MQLGGQVNQLLVVLVVDTRQWVQGHDQRKTFLQWGGSLQRPSLGRAMVIHKMHTHAFLSPHVSVSYLISKEHVKWCTEQAEAQQCPARRITQALEKSRIGAAGHTPMGAFHLWKLREGERENCIQTESNETNIFIKCKSAFNVYADMAVQNWAGSENHASFSLSCPSLKHLGQLGSSRLKSELEWWHWMSSRMSSRMSSCHVMSCHEHWIMFQLK